MQPGLNIIVLTADRERLRGALTLAAAHVAGGGGARLFLQLGAVEALRPPIEADDDARHSEAGLPTLAALLDEALGLGVSVEACQSGLALAHLPADALDARIKVTGPIGFLKDVGEADRLLIA